jgi:hypothetical protein
VSHLVTSDEGTLHPGCPVPQGASNGGNAAEPRAAVPPLPAVVRLCPPPYPPWPGLPALPFARPCSCAPFKTATAPLAAHSTPPRRNRAAAGAIRASRGELRCPADREPQQVFLCVPSPLRKLPKPLYSFSPVLTSPKQTPPRPPSLAAGEPLAGAATSPAKYLNRTLAHP